jgi:hypothetical protein
MVTDNRNFKIRNMSNKFKFILFHFFGISLVILGAILCTWFGKMCLIDPTNISAVFFSSLFFFLIWNLITNGLIGGAIMDGKKSIFNYLWNFKRYRNIKWIYHSELGYFPSVIGKKKLLLYRQNIFTVDELLDIDTSGRSIKYISDTAKSHLDWLYKNQLDDNKRAEQIKAKNDEIRKWDGFLDVPSRRDKKIDELLK